VKEFFTEFIKGLARWPLLMGALLAWALAIYEETVNDENDVVLVGVAGFAIGCILLGAWLVSYIVEGERRHYSERAPIWKHRDKTSAPPATGETQDGAEESEPRT
jgi:hypothetical protein